jgi:hypothetical protein
MQVLYIKRSYSTKDDYFSKHIQFIYNKIDIKV